MTKYVIVLIVVLLAILFLYNQKENLDASSLSNEALQNIASAYNTQNMSVTNLKVTGNLDVGTTFNIIPRGTIVAFNDTTAPKGWGLCDGGEYTAPNGDKVKKIGRAHV